MEPALRTTQILAISGSDAQRIAQHRPAARLAPPDIHIELFSELGMLPLFNPDIEATDPPAVANFRAHLLTVDGILIASPEYAHGITGVMKNALNWMVGCETCRKQTGCPAQCFTARCPCAGFAQGNHHHHVCPDC
ncbi:NADPH-dependent FMN reductase [Thiobacillus sp.]